MIWDLNLHIFVFLILYIICRRQMKEALAKLEKEVQELHKEEQTKLEEEKKKALDRLQRLVKLDLSFHLITHS